MNKQELIKTLEATLQELKKEEQETDFEEIVFKNNRKKSYFEWYDKIADKELSNLCKERFDYNYAKWFISSKDVNEAIMQGFKWDETEEKKEFWEDIHKRDDLETNPYIVSKWKPELGETYYIPGLNYPAFVISKIWRNDSDDKIRYERNLVCINIEKAKDKVKKMLNAIKD